MHNQGIKNMELLSDILRDVAYAVESGNTNSLNKRIQDIDKITEKLKEEERNAIRKTMTATKVKEVQALTGQGMMVCKKALRSAEGDVAEAVKILQTPSRWNGTI